jgi:hypothetical protein
MGIITKIEVQKNNEERANLYLDDDFCCGISIELVIKHQLKKGIQIDEEQLKEMILEDEKGNPFVFDFKFSPKTNKYEGLIQENRAMQLSLYKGLIAKTTQKNAKAVAYILLPEVKVVTAEELKGYIYKKDVKEERKGNLLVEMMNSYEYRKNQILNGIVEDGEEMEASLLEYNIDSEDKNLVPLDIEEHKKKGTSNKAPNKYSNYQIFKEKQWQLIECYQQWTINHMMNT